MNIILDKAYNRDTFVSFLSDNFLPEDFRPEETTIALSGNRNFATGVYRLGVCKSLDLEVFEVHHNSVNDARVGIAKDAFNMMIHHSYCNRALIAFVPHQGQQWRFSLLQIEAEINDKTNRIKRGYSNPRRYSFLLGEGSAIKTPTQFLIEKGRVRQRSEGNKTLTPWEDLLNRFSVEVLTKEFYNELFDWYQWAVSPDSGIYFPNNTETSDDDFEDIDKKIIRLITRLMFVWFIKQKGLVPNNLFDEKDLEKVLVNFDPMSSEQGNYYNAILQNLFFATLNRAIEDEEGKRGFAKLKGQRDVKSLYRYAEMFTISEEEVLRLFSEIPFLNGGLFECLDKTRKIDGVETPYNYDGFSRNDFIANGRYRHRAFIPNCFFFDEKRGLLNILKRYNFTIEENTPSEQQVALDPELLGKVFENLLGAYNPETKETARNQSGSFYTPREIVSYMVDESLIAYLGDTPLVRSMFKDDFEPDKSHQSDYQEIAKKLKSVKILDPACGSGAFPMGLLNRIVDLLHKTETDKTTYELKLNIIEKCIYGSDIQSIAAQITKLRFFISLICDCEKDASKPNFGIPTLPNLETKFVTADSLMGLKNKGQVVQGNLFIDTQISELKTKLHEIRHRHFRSKTASEKIRLRKEDEAIRGDLADLLSLGFESGLNTDQLISWNPYDQNAVSPFFDAEWMFGITDGFDIVIGNPPYIQLQNDGGKLGKIYQPCGYKTFASTGDMYCLFYERGHQLLKQGGHLCYITSNKWMRAGYGEKTRDFFAKETNPQVLIDFAGVKIFESATVDTNILLFAKATNQHKTICAVTNKQNKDSVWNLSDFVQQQNSICDFSTSGSWVILSPIEQSIKRKIEAVGTPLKDWDIQINYGIKTGFNDAFIITTEKRNEILDNCRDAEERQRTAELIRPILRGRDIKRYGYDQHYYLIATFPARHYDIEKYPAVKQYLLSFGVERLEQTGKTHIINGEKVKARKKTNNKWFETQDSISYWEDFSRPKIIWKRIGSILRFSYDNNGCLGLDSTCFATGEHIEYLCCVLNSLMGHYLLKDSPKTGTGDLLVSVQAIEPACIPYIAQYNRILSSLLVKQISFPSDVNQEKINDIVFTMYGLSPNEREYITHYVTKSQQSQ